MSYFDKTEQDLGEVKPKQTLEVKYIYSDEIEVEAAIPDCGCSSAYVDHDKRVVGLIYVVPSIPQHLKPMNRLPQTKGASVQYRVKSDPHLTKFQEIKFTAIIVEK